MMTVTRRSLLQSFLGVGGAAALVTRDAVSHPVREYPTYANPLYAEGLRLHWSGWKGSQEHPWLVGQWFAWPEPRYDGRERTPDPAYYYLSVPGMHGGRYAPGGCFNIISARFVFLETLDAEKDRLIWEGYHHLRELLRVERG
jgi:hypothetical protein